jgi:hypothetical protein
LRQSLLIAGFEDSYREQVRRFLASLPEIDSVQILSDTTLRLMTIDGVPVGDPRKGESWHTAACSSSTSEPGRFSDSHSPVDLTMADAIVHSYGARLGSRFDFETRDGTLHAILRATHPVVPAERFSYAFEIDCSAVRQSSIYHQALAHVRRGRLAEARDKVYREYPSLAVVTGEDVDAIVLAITRDIVIVARVVSGYAVASGLCILMALVAASRSDRLQEIGILRALGATNSVLVRILTVEFGALVIFVGVLGSALGYGLEHLLLTTMAYRVETTLEWYVVASVALVFAILTLAAGWLPSFQLLKKTPMAILRGE